MNAPIAITTTEPTVVHLFAGSGGCTLGFKRAGLRAAEAMAESRGFRVALRLAAIGRAVWAGVRRLTA